jgi:hypothetical protein
LASRAGPLPIALEVEAQPKASARKRGEAKSSSTISLINTGVRAVPSTSRTAPSEEEITEP